jgi:hypothetical protein
VDPFPSKRIGGEEIENEEVKKKEVRWSRTQTSAFGKSFRRSCASAPSRVPPLEDVHVHHAVIVKHRGASIEPHNGKYKKPFTPAIFFDLPSTFVLVEEAAI